jgi:hypothetical protein
MSETLVHFDDQTIADLYNPDYSGTHFIGQDGGALSPEGQTSEEEAARILIKNTEALLLDPIPHPSETARKRKEMAKQPTTVQRHTLTQVTVPEDGMKADRERRATKVHPKELLAPEKSAGQSLEAGEVFAKDPFAALAIKSRAMFDVYRTPGLNETEKEKKLDDYFRTIQSLDRMTFSNMEGSVSSGVPDGYLPDGFIDMGAISSLDPGKRYNRSMNYVDTYNTLHQHKAVFEFIFTNVNPDDFASSDGAIRYQQTILSNIAREIDMTMPYGEPTPVERGGILPISTAVPAMCQQHALTAQVLMQAFGIRSRLSKNYLASQESLDLGGLGTAGYDHVSIVVSIEGNTYMLDTTNPDYTKSNGWAFGLFRMNRQLPDGSWLVTEREGRQRKYQERSNMNWTVQRSEAARENGEKGTQAHT